MTTCKIVKKNVKHQVCIAVFWRRDKGDSKTSVGPEIRTSRHIGLLLFSMYQSQGENENAQPLGHSVFLLVRLGR